jgi:hypothetical protein
VLRPKSRFSRQLEFELHRSYRRDRKGECRQFRWEWFVLSSGMYRKESRCGSREDRSGGSRRGKALEEELVESRVRFLGVERVREVEAAEEAHMSQS